MMVTMMVMVMVMEEERKVMMVKWRPLQIFLGGRSVRHEGS